MIKAVHKFVVGSSMDRWSVKGDMCVGIIYQICDLLHIYQA